SSRRRHTRSKRDWSSDVCSSDLEIAQAMLQRQQASAIVAARQKVVEGAVGMAQDAISRLEKDGSVQLNEDARIRMINNLLVAIVADNGAQPIINAGTMKED